MPARQPDLVLDDSAFGTESVAFFEADGARLMTAGLDAVLHSEQLSEEHGGRHWHFVGFIGMVARVGGLVLLTLNGYRGEVE